MYTRSITGSYYPIDSPIHNLNIIMKLFNLIIYILVIIGSFSLQLHLFILTLLILQIVLSKVPLKYYFNMFYSVRYIYLIVIVLFLVLGFSLETSMIYLLKLIMTFEYLALITYTSSPSELNYGIVKLLSPINFLSINLNKVSLFITNMISFIPLLVNTESSILKSQASRGLDYYYSGIFGKCYAIKSSLKNVLRLTRKKMKDIKLMSELRMFNVKKQRTNLRVNKVGLYDIIFLAFNLLFIISYLLEANLL